MKIVTWNVNSIRIRAGRVRALLRRHRPDALCLQELKVADDGFPDFTAEGYESAVFGQAGRNGVAFLTRRPLDGVVRGFDGDPTPGQARVISGSLGGLRLVNCYVLNGRAVGTPEHALKLAWLDGFRDWLGSAHRPGEPLLVVGDFNIAPDDRDVHDPAAWRGRNLCSEPERHRLRALLDWGLVDLLRLHEPGPGPYTWWDYRAGAFHRGWGLRIDLALGTRPVAARCAGVRVDRDERKPSFGEGGPSDHAPVVITLDDGDGRRKP